MPFVSRFRETSIPFLIMASRASPASSKTPKAGAFACRTREDLPVGSLKASFSTPLGDGWGASLSGGWSGQDYLLSSGFSGGPGQNSSSRYAGRAQLAHQGDNSVVRLIVEQIGQNGRDGSPTATTLLVPFLNSTRLTPEFW